MEKINLKTLFREAWEFVWNNPILWLFGLFAAFFSNNEIVSVIKNYKKITGWIDQLVIFKSFQISIKNFFQSSILSDFFNLNGQYAVFVISVIFLLFFVSFLSQITIILSVKNGGKQKLPLKQIWRQGKLFLWPVIGIYLLVFVVVYGFLLLLGIPLFYKHLPIIISVVIFLLLGIFLSFVSKYIIFFIILEKEKFFKSAKSGLLFFIENWFVTIKTSFYVCLIAILAGLLIFLVSAVAAIPFMIIVDLFLRLNFIFAFWLTSIICSVLIIVFVLFLSSIFSTWQTSVWVSLFLKLLFKRLPENRGQKR